MLDSYAELQRYDSAAVNRDERAKLVPCAVQPRDLQIVLDVSEHKFLTGHQIHELHWPGADPRLARRRLAKLFAAGLLERFRPVATNGGSFPWTYHLGREGHRLLLHTGDLDAHCRYEYRPVYDYRYVLHELHLNSWVLAWRRLLGKTLVEWRGERSVEPPPAAQRGQLRLDDGRRARGLRDARARLLRPDGAVIVRRRAGAGVRTYLIEYDRTRRVDKNYEKFRRYDAFLCSWWHHTRSSEQDTLPFVVFVCEDEAHRDAFLRAADTDLTGHLWKPGMDVSEHEYAGRDHILFAVEPNMHRGEPAAWRPERFPRQHPGRPSPTSARGVRLPIAVPELARLRANRDDPTGSSG
jgi:Replication-relaxation